MKTLDKLEALQHLLWLGRRDKHRLSSIKQDYRKAIRALDALGLTEEQKLVVLRHDLGFHDQTNKPYQWLADRLK